MLTADVAEVIERYEPRVRLYGATWDEIGPVVRSWVIAVEPGHRSRAQQLLSAASALAAWCCEQAIPLRADTALRDSTIERFCAYAERSDRFSATTRATIRSRLRCIAAALRVPGNAPPAPVVPRTRIKAPYSQAEVAGLWRLTTVQANPQRRRRLEALLACSLGAGCGPEDFRSLGPEDVERHGDAVLVTLHGPRPRQVWVLAAYAAAVEAAAKACDESRMIGGRKADRRSVTTGLLTRIDTDPALPTIEPGRLRSTWLLAHLEAGTRLDILMAAAGVSSPTSIADLLRYLEAPPEAEIRRQLQGLPDAPAAVADAIAPTDPLGPVGA